MTVNLQTVQRAIQSSNVPPEEKKRLMGLLRTKRPEAVLEDLRFRGVRKSIAGKIASVKHTG